MLVLMISLLLSTGCTNTKKLSVHTMEGAKKSVAAGEDINARKGGFTRLYMAVYAKDTALVRYLLDNGADPNRKSSAGWQPLHRAVQDNQPYLVKMLLDRGADYNSPNPAGETPLQVAQKNGYTTIVTMINQRAAGTPIVYTPSDSATKTVTTPQTTIADTSKGKKHFRDDKAIVYVRFIKPIPSWIGPTRISGLDPKQYDISTWGMGGGIQKRAYKDLSIFVDFTRYSFKQVLVEEGGTKYMLNYNDITYYHVPFPLGVKYTATTTSIRLGVKYTYTKREYIQPWIGVAYGINVWNVQYVSMDETKAYGKANGTTPRHGLLAGVDFRMPEVGVFTFFFDAVSPVAVYTMKDLFGMGDFHQFDATTYPTPRIGISLALL